MRDLIRAQKCLQRLVIAYNVFFWVTGPGIVGLGAWVYVVLGEYQSAVGRQDFQGPTYIIIVAGGTSVIAGIVGCLGGVNEHKRLLKLYFLLMCVVCSLEISATVYSFLLYDGMKSTIRSNLEEAMVSYVQGDTDVMDDIDNVHRQFSCCGIDKPNDWLSSLVSPGNATSASIAGLPASCCSGKALIGECALTQAFQEGCLSDLVAWTQKIFIISGWTIFAMACTQLLALAVICCFTDAVSHVHFW